jgi:signal transduction histidine kinase
MMASGEKMPLEMLGDLHALGQGEVTEISDVQAIRAAAPTLGYLQEAGVWSYYNVPLIAHDKLVGSLSLGSDSLDSYSPATLKMVREVADPLAIAIQQARLFADVEAARERLQLLSQRLVEAQETERRHLARELHDEIGQSLTVIKINLESLQRDASNAAIAPRLQHSIDIVQHTLQQVRELSLDLRPALLDDLGLVATLRWYLDRQTQWNDLAVYFVAQPPDLTLPNDLETVCFRIVQEAMTNIIRHAQAQHVTVTLALRGATLLLMIEDDGVGFDVSSMLERVAHGESFGLSGMQERALLRDGQLTVDSAPGRGTTIEATFDVPASFAQPPSTPHGDVV